MAKVESTEALIEVRDFKKSFGAKKVHDGVTFDLRAGEVVSLLGASGSGKSVFLRSLIGLETPDSGSLHYKGKELANFTEDQWVQVRKEIAYAFQGGALFDSFTIEENLLYPLDVHTTLTRAQKLKRCAETLDMLGLKNSQNLYPADLSGGMQKRAGFARALILDPQVILYDEPTAGLDPFNTKVIQDIILDLKARGKAGILVTHDMPTALAVSERISLLHNGKIAVSGLVKEVKDHPHLKSFITGVEINGST